MKTLAPSRRDRLLATLAYLKMPAALEIGRYLTPNLSSQETSEVGQNQPHNNVSPYLVINFCRKGPVNR